MVAPIYDWSGFYIGGNGGWGESHSCLDFFNATGVDFADGCSSRSGGVVGGQFGYRWQASQWVFGLEAQGDWADLSNTRLSLFNSLVSPKQKLMASAFSPARLVTPGTPRCFTSRAARR